MRATPKKIKHILCPTDLSAKSQLTLNYASGIASRLSARITACHCSPTAWFSHDQDIWGKRRREIDQQMIDTIKGDRNGSSPAFDTSIFDQSFDPAKDILHLAKDIDVDLIVLKARKSMFSALHYGSIVERIARGSNVPVLLLPTRFLETHPNNKDIDFHQVLFDYDFSEATDRLFPTAMALTDSFRANLHLLAVLEPPRAETVEVQQTAMSRDLLINATQQKLDHLAGSDLGNGIQSPATVAWGKHAKSVLEYTEKNKIDLICTTLSPTHFYYEKLYCAYLGQLLQSAKCPILALRSV
jgi:nucleotide-binding universal stress UspA family protein